MLTILSAKQLDASQRVNSIGRSIFKSTDTAFKCVKSSQHCEVFFEVLYEIPPRLREAYNLEGSPYDDINTMIVSIDLTSYDNKVRANVIEQDPNELTLGHKTFSLDKYPDNKAMRDAVVAFMYSSVAKRYQDFDFIY